MSAVRLAFDVSPDDIAAVLRKHALQVANTRGMSFDALGEQIYSAWDEELDVVARAALAASGDLDAQTEAAHAKICDLLIQAGVLEDFRDLCRAEQTVAVPLTLYAVTLDWNPDNDEGDYSTNVWAATPAAAVLAVAEEMAAHPDAGLDENDVAGRAEFIKTAVDNASAYAALEVGARLRRELRDLLAGPQGGMAAGAAQDYEGIMAILGRYGVSR